MGVAVTDEEVACRAAVVCKVGAGRCEMDLVTAARLLRYLSLSAASTANYNNTLTSVPGRCSNNWLHCLQMIQTSELHVFSFLYGKLSFNGFDQNFVLSGGLARTRRGAAFRACLLSPEFPFHKQPP